MKTSTGGMSRLASSGRLVVVANPDSVRVARLNEARAARGQAPVCVAPWRELLTGDLSLAQFVREGDTLRIDSPGRNSSVERLLTGAEREAERGEIFHPRAFYDGFCLALQKIEAQLADAPPHRLWSSPQEIAMLFSKPLTQARFASAGLPVPPALRDADSLPRLAESMKAAGTQQAFVKLAFGSSASGAFAVRTNGAGQWIAQTTVEEEGGRLYNSRQIRTLTNPAEINDRLQALAAEGLHGEVWLPKAMLRGRAFDVRALTIAGKLRHVVARLSRSPFTNLHLLNDRADADTVRATVGERAWSALQEVCEKAAALFPGSLHVGFDVMWLPGFRRLALLEANAFGDLLPGALHNNQTTYEAELEAMGC